HLHEQDEEEFSFSPSIDLPGSVVSRYPSNLKKFNQMMMEPTKEPVVIRPTKAASLQSGYFRVPDENGNANIESSPPQQATTPASGNDRVNGNSLVVAASHNDTTNDSVTFDRKTETFDERNGQTGSPPLSICSVRSEDSGKGSSPPHSVGQSATMYEFLVPAFLVAGMLGKEGTFVKHIKKKTGANVIIKRNPDTHKSKICTLEGSHQEIQDALEVIREKFPLKRFPALTLQRIEISRVETVIPLSLMNDTCSSLPLIEGINNDVAINCIITVGHLFVHQPLHPTHLTLNNMQNSLNQSYTLNEAPALPEIIPNAVCVAFVAENWYRAQVVQYMPDSNMVLVKYLDYGGFSMLPPQNLRQIRTDFISVPFQSIECVLSNIEPIGKWKPKSVRHLGEKWG
uniref:Tudor domain-containing protein n=1 Tax=Anopheles maculatus TaxID=74869 RepID=A0A182T3B7_9DIPT